MRTWVAAATVVLTACGGLDNRPLRTGTVIGQLQACEAPDSVVGVVGDPSLNVTAGADCAFRLDGIEPGPVELFVAASAKKVMLVGLEARAATLTDLGVLDPRPGAFIRLSAHAAGNPEGELTAPDLPLRATAIGKSGMARLGPLPKGCFRFEVALSGLGKKALSQCFSEGEEAAVDVSF